MERKERGEECEGHERLGRGVGGVKVFWVKNHLPSYCRVY